MKINNKGNVSEFGGENGDLIIYLKVKNHKYFNSFVVISMILTRSL